jgi:hypothetical protein
LQGLTTSFPQLTEWHDYFMILGTASATLIGAMFVVVSIGSGFLNRDRSAAIRTFLSSTVLNLTTTLLGAALTMVPTLDWRWLGAIIGVVGIVGFVHSLRALFGFNQHSGTDHSDWFWYAIFPVVGYALLLAAAATALRGMPVSLDLLAAALAFLLVAGIRNAWDMIVFLVTMPRTPDGSASNPSG